MAEDGDYMARKSKSEMEDKVPDFVEKISGLLETMTDMDKAALVDLIRSKKLTAAESVRYICTKKEFVDQNLSDGVFIKLLYNVLYDRKPTKYEFEFWRRKALKRTRVGIINGILLADDWKELCKKYEVK